MLNELKEVPTFYINVLEAWGQIVSCKMPKQYHLWYNKDIKIQGKSVFYKDFYNLGINYVCDLIDERGNVVPFNKLVEKGLNVNSWLMWCGLLSAIRRKNIDSTDYNVQRGHFWIGKESKANTFMFTINGKNIEHTTSKDIYCYLTTITYGDDVSIPRAAKYLENTDQIDWEKVYIRPSKLILDVRTRDFQFRFLHDLLVNQYWLHKWKIKENNVCCLCGNDVENISHRFYDCTYIMVFWHDFNVYCGQKFKKTVNKESIFLGEENELLCTLIFGAKLYIHKCYVKEQKPQFTTFCNNISYLKCIECEIGRKSGRVDKWTSKWHPIL